MKRLTTVSGLALLASLAAAHAVADEKTAWRLFVSDHADPAIHAVDAETGRKIDTFAIRRPASLHRTASGRTVFAVQGKGDVVNAIASGIAFDDHGGHGDIKLEQPRLLDIEIAGKKPSHFVEHRGEIALFFDGDGKARIIREADVLAGTAQSHEVAAAAPHHGLAVALGGHVLVSEPNSEDPDELPVGVRVLDRAGKPVGDVHRCPELHGEASSGNLLAVACATGLLVVAMDGDAPSIRFMGYDDDLPEGKTTTLAGGRGLQYFLGNFGPDAVVLVDPAAQDVFRLIELPTRRVHFAVDPIRAKFAYVFTEDGQLHRIDVVAGRLDRSLKLTEPYSMDGHWSDPRPRIAVAGGRIVVSDPLKGVLRSVDAETFEPAGEIALGGKPFNLVAVGGTGEQH